MIREKREPIKKSRTGESNKPVKENDIWDSVSVTSSSPLSDPQHTTFPIIHQLVSCISTNMWPSDLRSVHGHPQLGDCWHDSLVLMFPCGATGQFPPHNLERTDTLHSAQTELRLRKLLFCCKQTTSASWDGPYRWVCLGRTPDLNLNWLKTGRLTEEEDVQNIHM